MGDTPATNDDAAGGAGHRTAPHTADLRVEAWGPSPGRCLAEAVAGMVGAFVDIASLRAGRTVDVRIERTLDADALVAVLDEVIYLLETRDLLPVATDVTPSGHGLEVRFAMATTDGVATIGAVPKAVSLHDLRWEPRGAGWWCAVTLDV